MPSRQRWCPPRRRSSAAQQTAELQSDNDNDAAIALGTMGCAAPNLSAEALLNEEPIMLQIARQLWRPDYEALFRAEHAPERAPHVRERGSRSGLGSCCRASCYPSHCSTAYAVTSLPSASVGAV